MLNAINNLFDRYPVVLPAAGFGVSVCCCIALWDQSRGLAVTSAVAAGVNALLVAVRLAGIGHRREQ